MLADTYTSYYNPDTSFGGATVLKSGGGEIWEESGNYKYHLCLKWDKAMPGLPERKKIVEANLFLYALTQTTISDRLLFVYSNFNYDDLAENSTFNEINGTGSYAGSARTTTSLPSTGTGYKRISFLNKGHITNYTRGMAEIQAHASNDGSRVIDFSSRESANPPYLEIIYEDAPPGKPVLIEPVSGYLGNDSDITLRWQYNSSVGGVQKKFDLQWSSNSGETWTTVSMTTSNNYYVMLADTLPAGNIQWRVRTFNEYDEVSEYSDIFTFYSVGAPSMPTITTISNSAKPMITWVSTGQLVYQLQISKNDKLIYDTGSVASYIDYSHKVSQFLYDGEYIARVRIKNEYDMFSDWTETGFAIQTEGPEKPELTIHNKAYCVMLKFDNVIDIENMYLYRAEINQGDFICLAEIEGDTYFDFSTGNNKVYKYFLRVVNNQESFADSDIMTGSCSFSGNTLAASSELGDIVKLKYGQDGIPKKSTSISMVGNGTFFDGRKHSVYEFSEFRDESKSLSFFVGDCEQVERLIELIERTETLLYRDNNGDRIFGVVNSLSIDKNILGYTVSFSITKVDYAEGVQQ